MNMSMMGNPSPEDQAVAPARLGRTIGSYRTLIETCRARAEELDLSRAEIDRISGLPEGFSGKLLGKDGCGPRQKKMWPVALEAMLGALGLKILLLEDDAATARKQRFRTLSRIGLKCSEPQAANRIKAALSLIEHEWALAQRSSDKRMIVEIGKTTIRTIR